MVKYLVTTLVTVAIFVPIAISMLTVIAAAYTLQEALLDLGLETRAYPFGLRLNAILVGLTVLVSLPPAYCFAARLRAVSGSSRVPH